MTSKTKAATAKTKRGPCTVNGEEVCPGMEMALRGGGTRGIGFRRAPMMVMATGEMTVELVYLLPKKVDGVSYLMVGTCPWCGANVRAPASDGTGKGDDRG